MPQGSFGMVRAWNDFTAPPGGITTGVPDALQSNLGGGWGLIGVNEGVISLVQDEPSGWINILTDTGDDDNHALVAGAWRPNAGGMEMEVRLKIVTSVAATRCAVFVGFSETMSIGTPVVPAETAVATTAYNGTGGMAGFIFDSDSTSLIWRFVAGNGGVALATKDHLGAAGGAVGVSLPGAVALVADRSYIFRLEMTPSGVCRAYYGDIDDNVTGLVYVGENTAVLPVTAKYHAVAMIENRVASAHAIEVDYADARGFRDWSVTPA